MDGMRALRFERTGSLDYLSVVDARIPVATGTDLLVKVGFAEAAEVLRNQVPAFEKGEFPLHDVQAVPLERGPDFYRRVDSGQLRAKVALTP
jgi:hypothetical protein